MEYLERDREREFALMDYRRVMLKRKGTLFAFAGTILLLMGIYSFTAAPKYKPEATLLVEEETSKILSIEDEFWFAGYRSTTKKQISINTQL